MEKVDYILRILLFLLSHKVVIVLIPHYTSKVICSKINVYETQI